MIELADHHPSHRSMPERPGMHPIDVPQGSISSVETPARIDESHTRHITDRHDELVIHRSRTSRQHAPHGPGPRERFAWIMQSNHDHVGTLPGQRITGDSHIIRDRRCIEVAT